MSAIIRPEYKAKKTGRSKTVDGVVWEAWSNGILSVIWKSTEPGADKIVGRNSYRRSTFYACVGRKTIGKKFRSGENAMRAANKAKS